MTMKTMTMTAAILGLAAVLGTVGCKRCDTHSVKASVTSDLRYTGSILSLDASADARVVDEPRTFADAVYVSDGRVELHTEVTTTVVYGGERVELPVPDLTLAFDRPATSGRYALEDLHARLCARARDDCGSADGNADVQLSSSGVFHAGLTLWAPPAPADDRPVLRGTARVDYEEVTDTDVCPDLGSSGAFAPE